MPDGRRAAGALAGMWALACFATPLRGGVDGAVLNASNGRPAGGVELTLSSFEGGMTPLEETVSAPDGTFAFTRDLPAVPTGQPFAGAIRAQLDGVYYTEILRSGAATQGVRMVVFSAQATGIPEPVTRVLLLEPSGSELSVRESFVLSNDSNPPVTFSSEAGSLRFHLPEEAAGQVDVSGTGPAGMPLRSAALPDGDGGTYKVDFPLKPGESQLHLSYTVPHEEGGTFSLRSPYDGLDTRLAVPPGVSLEGEGLAEAGEHPELRARIYSLPGGGAAELRILGQGRFSDAGGGGQGSEISVEPAPVASELGWIAGLSALILGLGFFHLMKARLPEEG